MRLVKMWAVLAVLVGIICFLVSSNYADQQTNGHKCKLERDGEMLGSNCRGLFLNVVPDDIDKKIMILDLAHNYLKELRNTSFQNYPSLEYLYLQYNYISAIDIMTFHLLSDLKVLNLALNHLNEVPEAINNLPRLQTLHLNHNKLSNVLFIWQLPNLEYLELIDSHLKVIPNLKGLSKLKKLNVTKNDIETVNFRDLAPLCQLQSLDLHGNKKLFARADDACNCTLLAKLSLMRGIKITPNHDVICQSAFDDLKEPLNNSTCYTNETKLVFQESNHLCEPPEVDKNKETIILNSFVELSVIIVMFGTCALLVSIAIIIFVVHRFRSNRSRASNNFQMQVLYNPSDGIEDIDLS